MKSAIQWRCIPYSSYRSVDLSITKGCSAQDTKCLEERCESTCICCAASCLAECCKRRHIWCSKRRSFICSKRRCLFAENGAVKCAENGAVRCAHNTALPERPHYGAECNATTRDHMVLASALHKMLGTALHKMLGTALHGVRTAELQRVFERALQKARTALPGVFRTARRCRE
eukprot:6193922-Pleurochrysis_carterae.AAC.3